MASAKKSAPEQRTAVVADVATLPDFTDPPVNETVLSIQFVPIPGFGIPHYGLYWSAVRDRFPKYQVLPELMHVEEEFGDSARQLQMLGVPGLQLISEPDARCWFLSADGSRLIQVQRDRFVHNWRKVTGSEVYPRYPAIRATLEKEWIRFCDFLGSESLSAPQVNQAEVTYVNHIEYKNGWRDFGELSNVIAFWAGNGTDKFLPAPERVGMEVHFRLPESAGRLHISAQPVIRGRDSREVLQVTVTARGAPKSSETAHVLAWMDLGREWVVKGFADFTGKAMHKLWGRKQ